MKKLITALLLSSTLLNADSNYLNFIIQIQSDPINTTHKIDDIDASGSTTALQGIAGSSVFQLWTIHRTTAEEHLLDEKTVSSYHPQATIKITSADPYTAIPRTRVDQPFHVTYTVSGIITDDPSVQEAAKSVVFNHDVIPYLPGTNQPAADAPCECEEHDTITANGTTTKTYYTHLQGTDLTTVRGEEQFSIYANPDFGVIGASLLAKAKVQIWPIAQASISGFDSTVEYTKIPSVAVSLVDLYPSSTTYLRVYKGAPTTTPTDPININTSYVNINDVEPQNRNYTLNSLDSQIREDGDYTLEILHQTPFGLDLLAQTYPLKVKRGIKVNGNINSSE